MTLLNLTRPLLTVGALALPHAFGFSSGPQPLRAGVPNDISNGAVGTTCTACHRTYPLNPDTLGKVTVTATDYQPGVKQTVKVRVEHPEGMRWGFELTARSASNDQVMAGSFTASDSVRVVCAVGAAPCSTFWFATHNSASNRAGTPIGVEWEVEWTPPASEIGDVIFYVAGNAANNDQTLNGDRIYNSQLRVKAGGACSLTKRPTLRSLSNAATFATTLAPNSMGSVFGQDFQVAGNSRIAGSGDFVNGAFPKQLACVAVEIAGQRAPVTYVQNDQINFQVPTINQIGPVPVSIILNPGQPNELKSDAGTVTMAAYSPGFFTFNGKSIAATSADGRTLIANTAVVAGGAPAKPGDIIVLYGTGFGYSDPVYQSGDIVSGQAKLRDAYTISIGGTLLTAADILYAGLAPGSISGLYQFNVRLPASLADGDIPIVVTMGGVSSLATATIPVKR